MENKLSRFIDDAELTPIQELVKDFYEEHPLCTRIECAKAIYSSANPFHLMNLGSVETQLRKKGYLFYTVKGIVIDMSREDIDVSLKLKVQKRMGGAMYGYIRSNIRIFQAATDNIQLNFAKMQFKEALQDLVDGEYIKINGVNFKKLELTGPQKLIKYETIKTSNKGRSTIHN